MPISQRRRVLIGVLAATAAAVVIAVGTLQVSGADKAPAVGDPAKDFELEILSATGGETVKLSKLTANGPVVLVVMRGYPGYQCPICTQQFGDLLGKANSFKKAGARVVCVYPGPSDKLRENAAQFVRGKDYPEHFRILLDPDYKFTNLYGLRWNARNETAYPSTFVVDRAGKITFAKVSTTHGGRAKTDDILNALETK
jgi:thioredoxin-dependent peroxiredoxin